MIIADKVFKGNTEIVKIFKGLNLEWEKPLPIPSADAYVQDGLVFHLDGIDKGNVEGAWIDRITNRLFTLNNCIVNSDNIEFNGTDSYAVDNNNYNFPNLNEQYTIEIVIYYDKGTILSATKPNSGGSPIVSNIASYANYFTVGRNLCALESPPRKLNLCMLLQALTNNDVLGNYNGVVAAMRYGTSSIISPGWYVDFYHPYIGCFGASTSKRSIFLKGKIYSIRMYNRNLTEDELYNNMVIDYMRFKLDIMDEFKVNLSNDLGEKINEALFIINNTLFNYTGNNPIYVPKSPLYFIQFNNIKGHTAPKAIIDPQSTNISAVYHYTGFDGMILEATTTAANQTVYLPFYSALPFQSTDWGDGTINVNTSHKYSSAGTYTIKITGTFTNLKLLPQRLCKYITKIVLFPYNLTIIEDSNYDRTEMPNLTYVAPLITNRAFGIKSSSPTNLIDCCSAYAWVVLVNSIYDRSGLSSYSLPLNVDTLILGWNGSGSIYNVLNINKLYKCNTKSSKITFDLKNGIPPYIKRINQFTSIRLMEIPKEFWLFYGNSIVWDFSGLSYWEGQSTLVNNTVDLVSEGKKTQTIKLSSTTKSYLTDTDIALITNKGYTIA